MINNRQQRSLIIKAIMLLLAFIVMIFAATLAWYSENLTATAEGLSVSTSADRAFNMAVGFNTSSTGYDYVMSAYSKEIKLEDVVTVDGVHYNVLDDFSPIDVTGDGATLVRPSMTSKNTDIDRNVNTFTSVTPNKEYISFDLYFEADEECKVYLDNGSFVKGAIEGSPRDGNLVQTADTGDNRKAAEGNFSKDAIVGAIRVAFVNYSEYNEDYDPDKRLEAPSLLWLPRPDIFLDCKKADDRLTDKEVPWDLQINVQPNEHWTEYKSASDKGINPRCDTYTHHYYSYKLDADNQKIGDMDYQGTVTSPDKVYICDINTPKNDKYYGKTQVNIWIEGCDAEARRTMSGGKFQINFDLAGG